MTDISELKNALLRAEQSGLTDADAEKLKQKIQLGTDVINLIERYCDPKNPNNLSPWEVEYVLAGLIGYIIRTASVSQTAAILVATAAAQVMLEVAIEDRK